MGTVTYMSIGGEILSENRDGVIRDYVPDPLGSTVAMLDATQTKTDEVTYWPYGEVRTRIGTNGTPFLFLGTLGYHTDTSGKTCVRARVLEPKKARWLTEDPIGLNNQDYTEYGYASGNPVTYIDPDGLTPCSPQIPPPPMKPGKSKIQLTYGKYCGPQKTPGTGKGYDPVDTCCMVHDACWASKTPRCTIATQFRKDCVLCTKSLCHCLLGTDCSKIYPKNLRKRAACIIGRGLSIDYACGIAQ